MIMKFNAISSYMEQNNILFDNYEYVREHLRHK